MQKIPCTENFRLLTSLNPVLNVPLYIPQLLPSLFHSLVTAEGQHVQLPTCVGSLESSSGTPAGSRPVTRRPVRHAEVAELTHLAHTCENIQNDLEESEKNYGSVKWFNILILIVFIRS